MADFPLHTPASAPEAARERLRETEARAGFLPNLHRIMAEAPAVLEAYQTLGTLMSRTSLSAVEAQVVYLTTSSENNCEYCVPGHSLIAEADGMDPALVEALREDKPLSDARLEALRRFTARVVRARGWVSPSDLARFFEAGFTQAQALEVVLGVAMKVLSNYTNHMAGTPLDDAAKEKAWAKPLGKAHS